MRPKTKQSGAEMSGPAAVGNIIILVAGFIFVAGYGVIGAGCLWAKDTVTKVFIG